MAVAIGWTTCPFESIGNAQGSIGRNVSFSNGLDLYANEVTGGQCACFVEANRPALGQCVERDAPFKQNPISCAGADRAQIGGWGCDDQCARGCSDQEGKGSIDRTFEAEIVHGEK